MTSRFAHLLLLPCLLTICLFAPCSGHAKDEEYPFPLKFEGIGDGIELKPLIFKYEIEKTAKRKVDFGAFAVDDQDFFISLKEMRTLHPVLAEADQRQKEKEFALFVRWPNHVFEDAVIEMISRSGDILWQGRIDEKTREAWSEQLESWKKSIKGPFKGSFPVYETQWGFRHFEKLRQVWMGLTEQVRFCISSGRDFEKTRLCTPLHELLVTRSEFHILPLISAPAPVRVIVNGREPRDDGMLQAKMSVPLGKPFSFFMNLSSGMTVEFQIIPEGLKFVEMYRDSLEKVILVGENDTPLQDYEWVQKEKVSPLVEFFGWQQTIGNLPPRWKTIIDEKNPHVYIRGKGGGVFLQEFVITRLPREDFRPYLHAKNRDSTYINGPLLRLKKPEGVQVTSAENKILPGENDEVLWDFQATERGKMNRSHVLVRKGDKVFKAYHEMYKGYPRELSARLSTILQPNGKILVMDEAAFNYWYEDVFGWQNRYLSLQRWGTSLKYFNSITPVETSRKDRSGTVVSTSATYQAITLDLKYRFEPGLWGRDETWGLMTGVQKVSYDVYGATLVGGGAFWARSMPKVFNDIFNILPMFRYPKWVDMDFIYYPTALTGVRPGQMGGLGFGTWSLNFHGKVLWTDSLFGEAGFGIRQSDFIQDINDETGRVSHLNFKLTLFYSTVGIGLNF